ncbi:MAG TPA: metallophosphoesterase family protein [Anaerolineae bacterium]|jgi:putative phosphoesterase|nr:metallophosphoesterase family protein [Anaerolineae bacterium]
MTLRLALVSDIHGNVDALEAALPAIAKAAPDRIVVLGDLVLNGPRPVEAVDRVMQLEAAGAIVIAGNTDIAVADGDYTAAFPWLDEVPAGHVAAAEWARDLLRDDQLEYLRRLPAERRLAVGGELILACHASPGSQTSGLPADLDAAVTVQRVTRTDARVICCGHTHVADVRELGRKLLLNPGSCGYAFDGTPDACWALLDVDEGTDPRAELVRTTYDPLPAAEEVAGRGLPGDVYRAATIRTGRFVR